MDIPRSSVEETIEALAGVAAEELGFVCYAHALSERGAIASDPKIKGIIAIWYNAAVNPASLTLYTTRSRVVAASEYENALYDTYGGRAAQIIERSAILTRLRDRDIR